MWVLRQEPAQWVWVPSVQRYRDLSTGRFLPRVQVLGYVDAAVAASSNASSLLGTYAAQGVLSPADFGDLFRQQLKQTYIQQYLLGRGGVSQMTAADWGSIGGMLREQGRHLDDLLAQLARGEISEAQLQARLQMYVNSSREAYERARARGMKSIGAAQESWVVDAAAENCPDCLALQAKGWVPVGELKHFPGDGNTQCLTNCQCTILYKDADGKVL